MGDSDSHYTSISATRKGVPDLKYINKRIPIADVARALDLKFGENGLIHCWRPELHHNGDRTASASIRTVNNTVKCFGCGIGPLGPVDLTMSVLALANAKDAGLWIAERFEVPSIASGKHIVQPKRHHWQYGLEDDLQLLFFSGMYAKLPRSTTAIASLLRMMAERDEKTKTLSVTVSYQAISRYTGVASYGSIRKAIKELQEIGWLATTSVKRELNAPIRETSTYIVTPRSNEFMEIANYEAVKMKGEINAERDIRKRQKEERRRTLSQSKNSLQ